MRDVLIYTYNYDLDPLGLTPNALLHMTSDFDKFRDADATKIAIVEYDYCDTSQVRSTIDRLESLAFADLVIFKSIEGNTNVDAIVQHTDRSNFVFFLGYVPERKPTKAKIVYDSYWLKATANFYLSDYNTFNVNFDMCRTKDIPFEVLYGVDKPHRRFVRDCINSNPAFLESKFLETNSVHNDSYGNPSDIFWQDGVVRNDELDVVTYLGVDMMASQVIPSKVYNKTAYSVVCETDYRNQFMFPTEKIAKPMIAGRLFIAISGWKYLQGLHELGFKTFGSIIDESYDQIEDDHTRWKAAIDEAVKLSKLEQAEVLQRCAHIFAHNQEQLIKLQYPYFVLERYVEEYVASLPSCVLA